MTRFIRLIESPAPAPASDAKLEFGACSDTGRVRENNEDFFGAARDLNLFVLSDGMGGMSSGEVASRITVETILAHCREAESDPRVMAGPKIAGVSDAGRHLASAIHLANRKVREAWQGREKHAGMGATVIAARCVQGRLSLAHVGDSRAYRLRDRRLERLTQDHSLIAEFARRGHVMEEEAGSSGMQNVLLRAVGMEPEVEVEVSEDLLLAGDTLLLCSDGLTRELSDAQIEDVLQTHKDVQAAADHLVNAANQAGGADNITAIVVRHSAKQTGMFFGLGRLKRRFES